MEIVLAAGNVVTPLAGVRAHGKMQNGLTTSSLTITIWAVGNPCCILELLNKLKEKEVNKKYIVTFTADERAYLHQTIAAGKGAARKLLHARILLKADASPAGPG